MDGFLEITMLLEGATYVVGVFFMWIVVLLGVPAGFLMWTVTLLVFLGEPFLASTYSVSCKHMMMASINKVNIFIALLLFYF